MKQFIRDYLTFNKRERNGIIILLSIITLLLIYLNVSDVFRTPEKVDFTKFEQEIAAFNAAQEQIKISEKERRDSTAGTNTASSSGAVIAEYFSFNPNNLPVEDWKRLGLNEKQVQTIKNYESKGGQFRTKEDVKKMYCISEEQYLKLEPYISIPPKETHNNFKQFEKNQSTPNSQLRTSSFGLPAPVELNSADSAYLTKVKGIGAFYAKSIVKYRDQLGGFAYKEQLMEIWKFDQAKFDAVKDYIIVDDSEVRKININACTADQLKHPYISWNMANAIVNYRNQHGKYKKLEEIKKTDLVNDETFRKLVYYLVLE
jgi:DNA uptake protein ComE-like DNA-binding protein